MAARPPNVGVLIPAGGRGERAGPGDPKQFRLIGGIPMLLRALRPFARHPRVRSIVVALPEPDATAPPDWLGELIGDRLRVVPGGTTRRESVGCALRALDPACTVVLVHDAARPFVTLDDIDAIIEAVDTGRAAIVALPVSDTLKRADADHRIVETVPRERLWQAQTPQGFPRTLLERAYEEPARGAKAATDDAALVEALGADVMVVPGRTANLKVTTPEDFRLAEALVAQ